MLFPAVLFYVLANVQLMATNIPLCCFGILQIKASNLVHAL